MVSDGKTAQSRFHFVTLLGYHSNYFEHLVRVHKQHCEAIKQRFNEATKGDRVVSTALPADATLYLQTFALGWLCSPAQSPQGQPLLRPSCQYSPPVLMLPSLSVLLVTVLPVLITLSLVV